MSLQEINLNPSATTTSVVYYSNKTIPSECSINTIVQDDEKKNRSTLGVINKLEKLLKFQGLLLAVFSTIALICSVFLIKLSKVLNSSDMAFIKFAVQLLFCLPFAYFYKQNVLARSFDRSQRILLASFAITSSIALICLYFAVKMIVFTESIAIKYSSSIIILILTSYMLKKEKISINLYSSFAISILIGILGLVGLFFIIRLSIFFRQYGQKVDVESSLNFILGVNLALISAIFTSISFMFIKKLTKYNSIHFSTVVFQQSLSGMVISFLTSLTLFLVGLYCPTLSVSKTISPFIIIQDVSLALLSALIGFLSYISFTMTIDSLDAYRLAFLRYLDIPIAVLLDFLIYGKWANFLTLIGTLIILLGVLIAFIYKLVVKKLKEKVYKEQNITINLFKI